MSFLFKSLIKRIVVSINKYKKPKLNIIASRRNPGKTLNELSTYKFKGIRVTIVKYNLASPAPHVFN
jgi:hypothetical protein